MVELLFIICSLVFIATFSFGLFWLIKGIIKKDLYYIRLGLISFGITISTIAVPFMFISGEIAEAFSN